MNKFILKEFQEESIEFLLDNMQLNEAETLILKSPTGSGKTLIMTEFIEKYYLLDHKKSVCVWLSPGVGELEEQSKEKFERYKPLLNAKDLNQVLSRQIEEHDTIFINWESVSQNTIARRDRELQSLSSRIEEAKLNGLNFFLVIDESHRNMTNLAKEVVDLFDPYKKILVSATPIIMPEARIHEVSEQEVINSGLITKQIYINEKLDHETITEKNFNQALLNAAIKQRNDITAEFRAINENINPLTIIQFPNESPEEIKFVEDYLIDKGYSYENGKLAIWLSEEKRNIEDITNNNSPQCFLIMKQAISVGWDCPRAQILVGLRQGMEDTFKVQTLGRIRRMPKGYHYENELLDCSYLYTLDANFIISARNFGATQRKHVSLKDKPADLRLTKQIKNTVKESINEKHILNTLFNGFLEEYKLETKQEKNPEILKTYGLDLSEEIDLSIPKGYMINLSDLRESEGKTFSFDSQYVKADAQVFANDLRKTFYNLNKILKLPEGRARTVFEILFLNKYKNRKHNLLKLNKVGFTAFIINNQEELLKLVNKLSHTAPSSFSTQQVLPLIEEQEFRIPLNEWYPYDENTKDDEIIYENNAYYDYSNYMVTSRHRSTSERLFERYCENSTDILWYYKNGDTGKQYFSVVYVDNFGNQRLFYADYIVKTHDEIWIIETKGGESGNQSKNIDDFVKLKFDAFKNYVKEFSDLKWGFVRDKDENLYINSTNYSDEMSNPNWIPLHKVLK